MIKTGNPVISIYTEMTPNPETMKFVANKFYTREKVLIFPMLKQQSPPLWQLSCLDFLLLKVFYSQ